jgi:8-oxo-dGTP diphosphatase
MRVTTAGIAEKNGTFFLAQRKPGSSIGERWEFPGGKVRKGESSAEALKREFFEEFRVTISVGELFCTGFFTNGTSKYELQAYRIEILDPQALDPQEHQQVRWVPSTSLQELPFPESDTIIVNALLDRTRP